MYIYSVTIHIQKDAEADWVRFMQTKHLQDVVNTRYFKSAVMRKALTDAVDGASTYNMEYTCESEEQYRQYVEKAAPQMQKDVADKFGGKFTAQRAFYEVIFNL